MDTEHVQTFLNIVTHGSFVETAHQLHLTQSTVSARIQRLEQALNAQLFVRNRSGASLTAAGQQFLKHAKRLVSTANLAQHDVGLTDKCSASLSIGADASLWSTLLTEWVSRMRQASPDIAIRAAVGFEEDVAQQVLDGRLDIGLLHKPRQHSTLVVTRLFEEQLLLVASPHSVTETNGEYVHIEEECHPPEQLSPVTANSEWLALQLLLNSGGRCYLPECMLKPWLDVGQLHVVKGSPTYSRSVYLVYSQEAQGCALDIALDHLHKIVAHQDKPLTV
ncbi:LysR family transcriptional regulator [Thiothrix lacustris]|uniref:LysR family transcriptional regulator n=1 Tax=Thiothrix lacustris TaxID=525917 RepID=UPI0027E4F9F5|nr:LysR family transcriptional regulator [Thiothrix lacustris]WMP17772.1 LysR family transcriptional regulator [Thiothrix lacustris]